MANGFSRIAKIASVICYMANMAKTKTKTKTKTKRSPLNPPRGKRFDGGSLTFDSDSRRIAANCGNSPRSA